MIDANPAAGAAAADLPEPSLGPVCERYIAGGYRSVEGWLPKLAVLEIAALARMQRRLGVAGPTCEIGVHHGRTLILLHLLAGPTEITAGVDLYELISESGGRARKARMLSNLHAHGGDPHRVRTLTADSRQLSEAQILELCGGRPRLFSIDGGRTAGATYNDLRLACATVCDGGIVMLGDYFQEAWPEVSEGACRFLMSQPQLRPLAIGGNKVFFTQSPRWVAAYHDGLTRRFGGQVRRATLFGEPILLITPLTLRLRLTRTAAWRSLRDKPVGRLLRKIGGRIR